MNKSAGAQRASILMIALWSLFILAGFAVILGYQVRQKMILVKRLETRNKLFAVADGAIPLGIATVKGFADASAFSLRDAWSNNPSFAAIPIADGTCSFVRPLPEPSAPDRERVYGMVDEESKININKADIAVLSRLMQVVVGADETEAQALAGSLIDWRDADSELCVPMGSAEDSYYRDSKYPYEAKNAPFQTIDEVRLVKGFDANVFEKLESYITIYGSGRVNVNTAGKAVLQAIGFSSVMADRILNARAGKDSVGATDDDVVFTSASDVTAEITKSAGLTVTEVAEFNGVLEKYASVQSTVFTIYAVARSPVDKGSAGVICVFKLDGRIVGYRRL